MIAQHKRASRKLLWHVPPACERTGETPAPRGCRAHSQSRRRAGRHPAWAVSSARWGLALALVLFAGGACRKSGDQKTPTTGPSARRTAAPVPGATDAPVRSSEEETVRPPEFGPPPGPDEPVGPDLPRTEERAEERARMVERQIEALGFRDRRVLAAMRNVPRHWFVPEEYQRLAYANHPLPIGHGQTISQPYIVAVMTRLLDLEPGEKVLEIGTGSGYQAAVLAELTEKVYTIEIIEPLARRTMKLFEEKGYTMIHTRIGDGYEGWPEEAPFDAIIVTCSPEAVPPPLLDQLATGGRMCIPVAEGDSQQNLILFEKDWEGDLIRKSVTAVRFVPMTGKAQQTGQ